MRALNIHLGWRGQLLPPHLRRRALAIGLVVVAALLLAAKGGSGTRRVVVAAHDLTAGSRLVAADLKVVTVPADAVPAGAPDSVTALVGQTVSGPVGAREPLTATRLSASTPSQSGLVGAPVRLVDPAVGALLRPGQLVDVVSAPATDGAGAADAAAHLVARDVRVLSVPATSQSAADGGTLVVLEVSRADALALATAEAAGRLSVTLLNG